MTIIRAILEGERDGQRLATHRDHRWKHDHATIAKALAGHWRAEPRFALQQALDQYEFIQQQVRSCDMPLEACLVTWVAPPEDDAPRPAPARKRRARQRPTPDFEVHVYRHAMTGVALPQIDGIASLPAWKLIGEIGLDMSRWPTSKGCASWLGLCPGNKVSGGKRDRIRRQPTATRAAMALRLAAQGLAHSHSALGAYYRRMRARLGAPKAMTATAHTLARLV